MATPTITSNQLNISEGQIRTLSLNNLNASAAGTTAANVRLTILPVGEAPLAGMFVLRPVGSSQAAPTMEFTVADVQAGRVDFVHDRSNTAPAYRVVASVTTGSVVESSEPSLANVAFTPFNDAPIFQINNLSITEGGTAVLTPNDLLTVDEPGESGPEALRYEIISVANGQFQKVMDGTTTNLGVANTFTQADVNAGLIQFKHDGSETRPTYELRVVDGGLPGTGPATEPEGGGTLRVNVVEFTPVNDAPVITKNTLSLTEGGIVQIGTNNLAATDVEDSQGELTFTVTSITGGRFELVEGSNVTVLASPTTEPIAFTQEQIFQGRVRFVNDPATEVPPTYTIQVADTGDPVETATSEAVVIFQTENDSPILTNLALALAEGDQITLSANNLLVEDEESAAAGLTYSVDSVTAGSFVRVSDGATVTEFTQAQINAEAIAFKHNGGRFAPTFSLTVTDEGGESIVIDSGNAINFTPVNDRPTVVRAQLAVTEGLGVSLSSANNLLVTDEETTSGQLVYTVTLNNQDPSKPNYFVVNSVEQRGPTVTFTQAQVGAGQVRFVHGGSNFAPNLTATVTDTAIVEGGEVNTVPVNLAVNFTAINDEPNFLINTLTITEGGAVVLNAAETNLLATDEESDATELIYTIGSVSNGEFQRIDTPEVTPLTVGDSFSQADVDQGFIQFVQDGSENPPDYQLILSDSGINGDPTTIKQVTRTLVIPDGGFNNTNDPPAIVNNTLTLSEGDTVTLTLQNLSATDPEDAASNLVFTVTAIANGRIERVTTANGQTQVEVLAAPTLATPLTFTQAEVAQGRIRFVNDPATGAAPSYTVQVSDLDPVAPLTASDEATVIFTEVNDAPVLQTLSLTLTEGDTIAVTPDVLLVTDEESPPESVQYTVDTVTGGRFVLAADGSTVTSFTQADINAGTVIAFEHDGLNDAPSFSLKVSDGENEIIITDELGAGVTFTPTNDEPLVVASAFTVAENGEVILGADTLKVVDEESEPANLTYTVAITNASAENPDGFRINGELVTGPEVTFTQAQVNAGQVAFVQGGSNVPPELTFTVTDTAIAEGGLVNITPVPVEVTFNAINDEPTFLVNTLSITEGDTVVLNQGDVVNLLSTDEESAPAELIYTVTSVENGEFQRNDTAEPTPILVGGTFSQADVDQGLIQFAHDGSEFAPNYQLKVTDSGVNNDPATALSVSRELSIPEGGFTNVNDPPAFVNNTLSVIEGETVTLTLENLSAADAEDEASSLIFTVTAIANGRIERVTTVEGEPQVEVLAGPDLAEPISFTQAEVAQGLIRFVNDPATNEPPSYTVQVSDLDLEQPLTASSEAAIAFTPINDAPELQTFSLTLSEGDTVALNPNILSVVDEESAPENVTYTVDSVAGGSFVLVADGSTVNTFTQADINAGNVIAFQQDNLNAAPDFSLKVSDGENEIIVTDESDAGVVFTPINDPPVVEVSAFAVNEAGEVTLGPDSLLTVDEESAPEDLLYTVTIENADPDQPDGFRVDGELLTGPTVTFTQAQVNAGLVTFVHGGSNFAPNLTAFVTDTFDPEFGEPIAVDVNLDVAFNAINDPPVVVNNLLEISEGEALTLTTANLLTTDEETLPEALTYTVDAAVNGSFQRLDPDLGTTTAIAVGETFTQAEVNSEVIQFVHNGGEQAPSYTLTVTDTPLAPEGEANSETFNAFIPVGGFTNVNDDPTLTANTLTIAEGGTVLFTAANLAATDPDSVRSQLRFAISGVTGGTFFLNGQPLTETTTFTTAAIAFGELSFKDDGDEVPPTYTVTVRDRQGGVKTEAATVIFEPVNDPPTIIENTFRIVEGQRLTLNDPETGVVNLFAIDPETSANADLTYVVTKVTGGQFFDFEANPIDSFTQAQLVDGDINFRPDGSDTAPAFTITVVDPEGAENTVEGNVEFIIINDPPTLEAVQLTVTEGEVTILSAENFTVADPDTEPANLTFEITGLEGGRFVLLGPNGEVPEENISGTFTGTLELTPEQVETALADGLYVNLHTANYPGGELRGQIDLAAAGVTTTGVLTEAQQVNSVPDTAATGTFEAILEGNILTISGTYSNLTSPLQPVGGADAAGNPESAIHVHLGAVGTNGPILQNLLVDEISTGAGLTSFTLAQVIAGEIGFVDDGDQTPPVFSVSVSDGEFETDPVPAVISEFINTNDPPMAVDDSGTGFSTTEQAAFVTASVLANDLDPDPEDVLSVVQINGANITEAPIELASGALLTLAADGTFAYDPNGQFVALAQGETATDSFEYTVSDAAGVTSTATVTIEIAGVNDAPTLETNRLIISLGQTLVLTENNLLATDPDTDVSELVFTVSGVTGGQFLLAGEETTSFTQQDILAGNVSFVQDGTETPPTYSVAVTDGIDSVAPDMVDLERFIPVNTDLINGGIFDYAQFLRLQNLDAAIPANEITSLPIAQLFDEQYYLANNTDVAAVVAAGGLPSGYQHFVQFGLAEGRGPSALYDEAFYLANNPDVAAAVTRGNIANGLQHFLNFGVLELRSPSSSYDQTDYLDTYGDVLSAVRNGIFNSGFEHYVEAGANELRDPQLFLFNEGYYLANNQDVAAAVAGGSFVDGYAHFVSFGQREGRSPSLLFDEQSYLALNPDVAAAVAAGGLASGFSHFAQFGRFEGREVFL